ncbi:hypothetical protein LCGC14_0295080 [marine sediment metagenome]|uniref:Uncharacterized protein n=1 Tax=marine sediment metagenome TaxID=412755 RepID=A0A0F9TS54_9ZZZZ
MNDYDQYGNSGAPTGGEVSSEQRQEATKDAPGAKAAHQQFEQEEVVAPTEESLVAYVAAGEHANSKFLVKAGVVIKAPMTANTPLGMTPLSSREGDVWAKFVNGVMVTDDPLVIKWCSERPAICRRSDDPLTKSWATIKDLQTKKANRELLIDPSAMDADEDFPAGTFDHSRGQGAKEDSPGGKAVAAAELSRLSAEQERAKSSSVA